MEEDIRILKDYVLSQKPNLGDDDSILPLLYDAYGDANRTDDAQIKADFDEMYHLMNGMPLREMEWIINPVCSLCRDRERSGFILGVQVGIRLAQEGKSVE